MSEKNKNYFTKETENAIKKYNETNNQEEKNTIFIDYLKYPLSKLIENVIHTYKLYNTGLPYNQLFDHILEYVIEKLYKVNLDKGKAFSYLTVTARNYGFVLTANNKNENEAHYDVDDCYELDDVSRCKHTLDESLDDLSTFFTIYVKFMKKNLHELFHNKEELEIANVLLEIFDQRHEIDLFNKKALYIIIKEKTRCESRFITGAVNIFKINFYKMYDLYKSDNLNWIKTYDLVKHPPVKRRLKNERAKR